MKSQGGIAMEKFIPYEPPYCECKVLNSVSTEIGEWGQWDVCNDCNRPVEDTFEYFNHYDGEDHVFEY